MPREKRISEQKIILLTAGLLIFAGLIRLKNYPVGIVLFYLSFLPYLLVRIKSIRTQQGTVRSTVEKYRIYLLVAIALTLVMNITGRQEANFFVLFLLMLDYLMVTNSKL